MKKILEIKTLELKEGQFINYNNSFYYGVIYLQSGNIKLKINDQKTKIYKSSLSIISPYDFYTFEAIKPSKIFLILYTKEFLTNYNEGIDLLSIFSYQNNDINSRVIKINRFTSQNIDLYLFREKTNQEKNDYLKTLVSISLAYLILNNIFLAKTQNQREIRQEKLSVDQIIIYIRVNIKKSFKITDMANHFNVSPSYLSAYYHKKTNNKLIDTILDYRFDEAIRLLNSGYSVQKVYSECGFNSYNHFFKQFKKKYHISPKQYINS